MTDIWRSFVAQRIAWEYGWGVLFHESTVRQERNEHNLMKDFEDEIVGYCKNDTIYKELERLDLKKDINKDLLLCYKKLIAMGLIEKKELLLLEQWQRDIRFVL
jgi:hypothetical protein